MGMMRVLRCRGVKLNLALRPSRGKSGAPAGQVRKTSAILPATTEPAGAITGGGPAPSPGPALAGLACAPHQLRRDLAGDGGGLLGGHPGAEPVVVEDAQEHLVVSRE